MSRNSASARPRPSPGTACIDSALTPAIGGRGHGARVCHHGLTASAPVNPIRVPTTRSPARPFSGVEVNRSGPEAEPSPVNPACSLALRPFETLEGPHHPVACLQAPSRIGISCRRTTPRALTCKATSSSTTSSRGPSLARSVEEQKASQSLPAPEALALSRGGRCPRGSGSEVSVRSACAFDLRQPSGWALLKRVEAVDLPTRHPMPAPDPAITEHACSTPQAVVFAPMGSPLVFALTFDTALDFRSGAAPCERMALRIPGLIPHRAQGQTFAPT